MELKGPSFGNFKGTSFTSNKPRDGKGREEALCSTADPKEAFEARIEYMAGIGSSPIEMLGVGQGETGK